MTTLSHAPGYVVVGDRVVLTRDTLMDKGGTVGTVTRKYAPPHCTGAWSVTVKWDGNIHETGYCYPTDLVVRADAFDEAEMQTRLAHQIQQELEGGLQ